MATFGRNVIAQTGQPVTVSADGRPEWKAGGVTIDWSTVAAVSGSPATLADGTVVPVGQKYLQYGQVLCQITASGLYGPAATANNGGTAATDGRQLVARGFTFILNQTVLQSNIDPLVVTATDNPAVLEGGKMWRSRINTTGVGAPTYAQIEAALPRMSYAVDG